MSGHKSSKIPFLYSFKARYNNAKLIRKQKFYTIYFRVKRLLKILFTEFAKIRKTKISHLIYNFLLITYFNPQTQQDLNF